MNCAEIEELAGALALRAVPDAEAAEVYEHLATCPEAHQLVAELMEVVQFLPLAVDDVEPPRSLRSGLLAAALADAAPVVTVAARPTAPPQEPALAPTISAVASPAAPLSFRSRTGRRWLTPAVLAAAALFLLALGLGAWNVSLQRRLDDRTASVTMADRVLAAVATGSKVTQLSRDGGVFATFVQPSDGGPNYIIGKMPALAPDKSYEAWFIRDGKPVAAGVFHTSGLSILTLQGNAQGAQAVALTLEPLQGSSAPTLPILASAPLS